MREICFSTPIKVLLTISATAILFNFIYLCPHNSSLLLALFVRLFYLILCFWPTTYLFCPKFYTIFGATYIRLVYSQSFCSWTTNHDSAANDNSNYYYLAGLHLTKYKEFPQAIFIFYFHAWLTIVNRPIERKK